MRDLNEEPYQCEFKGIGRTTFEQPGDDNATVAHWYFRCLCSTSGCNSLTKVNAMLSNRILCRNGKSYEMCNSGVRFCKYTIFERSSEFSRRFFFFSERVCINQFRISDSFINPTFGDDEKRQRDIEVTLRGGNCILNTMNLR